MKKKCPKCGREYMGREIYCGRCRSLRGLREAVYGGRAMHVPTVSIPTAGAATGRARGPR